jgi:hypothetical protein
MGDQDDKQVERLIDELLPQRIGLQLFQPGRHNVHSLMPQYVCRVSDDEVIPMLLGWTRTGRCFSVMTEDNTEDDIEDNTEDDDSRVINWLDKEDYDLILPCLARDSVLAVEQSLSDGTMYIYDAYRVCGNDLTSYPYHERLSFIAYIMNKRQPLTRFTHQNRSIAFSYDQIPANGLFRMVALYHHVPKSKSHARVVYHPITRLSSGHVYWVDPTTVALVLNVHVSPNGEVNLFSAEHEHVLHVDQDKYLFIQSNRQQTFRTGVYQCMYKNDKWHFQSAPTGSKVDSMNTVCQWVNYIIDKNTPIVPP